MFFKGILWTTVASLVIGLGFVATSAAPTDEGSATGAAGKGKDEAKNEDKAKHEKKDHKIYVRICAIARREQEWSIKNHSGKDVLKMIEELKPDVLNRFINGKPNPNLEIPMGSGEQPMKFTDYLTAAMKAGASDCTLTPKVHLNDIWSDEYRMQAAKALVELPVTPKLYMLDLDCYFSKGSAEEHKHMLVKFKQMGWKDLGFNFVGGDRKTFGLAQYGEAAIKPGEWSVSTPGLAIMKKGNVKTLLAHIDYPEAIEDFGKLKGDRQAEILRKIQEEQYKHHFTFIYPVLYCGYDSTKHKTSKGQTIFEVIKELIGKDRKESGRK